MRRPDPILLLLFFVTVTAVTFAQDVTIPEDLIVSRSPRPDLVVVERGPFTLSSLSVGTTQQIFEAPPCLTGNYYLGVQLFYDLGDTETQVDWRADLTVSLLNGTTVLWTKPLNVRMSDQTFISTVFHSDPISCSTDYTIRIDSKTTWGIIPQDNIYLKFLLYKKHEDVFTPSASASLNCTNNSERSVVSWSYSGKAVIEYDLEWVFIANHENFTGTTPQQAFAFKEPVRITTAASYYKHSTYYPNGSLWYRVRAVGYNPAYPDHRIPGTWFYFSGDIAISNLQPDINWQQQTIFAEAGKYKKVLTYFDGSLRQRQSQTNLSTSGDTAIVSETLYDYEGRSAVEVLAAPAASASLTYKPTFNQFLAQHAAVTENTTAARKKFHYDNDHVSNSIVNSTGGAGMYYSPSNSLNAFYKDYVPDAEGYVYSQTEYLNDGTGRVRRVSGVGKEFRTDGGHITQYYYGSAAPAELIRLFGSNVGNANHYKKNMQLDPNGQASITYHDQEGRVIASALGGINPGNVNPLDSYSSLPSDVIAVDLGSKNRISDGKSITTHKILNTVPTAYTFTYNFTSLGSLIETIGCVACAYTLKITITDPTGKQVHINTPPIPGNESSDGFSYEQHGITIAEWSTRTQGADVTFTVNFTEIGDYTVTKSVVPTELTFEQVNNLLRNNAVIQTKIQDISDSYVVDASNCDICTTAPEIQKVCPEAETYIEEAITEIASADCENIYQQIVQDLRDQHPSDPEYEPTEAEIVDHAWHCEYLLCLEDMESTIFEKKIARIYTWSQAVDAGYDISMSNVTIQTDHSDPFFVSGNGHSSILSMQDKLNAITIPGIQYDSDYDGFLDANFTGTILEVTDPLNTNYYITQNGRRLAAGNHVLYFDLMSRRKANQLTEADYQAELNAHRWIMFKMFYLEAKRKIKLQLEKYTDCAPVKAELDRTDQLPTTESGIAQWGAQNGVTEGPSGPVSDEELDAIVQNIAFNCNQTFDGSETTIITDNLRSYFNANHNNFLRLIRRMDVQSNGNLIAINDLLASKGCSLDSIAVDDYLTCARDTLIQVGGASTQNLINNPLVLSDPSQSNCTSNINARCYPGWTDIAGTPNTSSQHTIFQWAKYCNSSEVTMGSFSSPLIPGHTYQFCFSYRAYSGTGYLDTVDVAKITLSRSSCFVAGSTETIGCNSSSNTSVLSFGSSNFEAGADTLAGSNVQSYGTMAVAEPECTTPRALYPDSVYVGNNTSASVDVWHQAGITNQDFQHVCITFTPTEASTYFFIAMHPYPNDLYQGIVLKDFALSEIGSTEVTTIGTVCKEYDTLGIFSYALNWNRLMQKCLDNAAAEREILVGYAVDRLIDEEASLLYAQQHTQCLDNLSEALTYAYVPKEYHYTLYYYDQAGNLVQTVPPEGVKPLGPEQVTAFLAGTKSEPPHKLLTGYQYNSLNQSIWQITPDAGASRFWYDEKAQLRLSQNAQQFLDQRYSYTKYDPQGRIIEVGEMHTTEDQAALVARVGDAEFPLSPEYAVTDITRTFYDHPNAAIQTSFTQTFLRNRVSWVEVLEKDSQNPVVTYYSYDIHGNVNALLQQIPGLSNKRTDYLYDLVSGKINYVMYQYGEPDQFIHRYIYDADNRIREVSTSTDGYLWNVDATYQYYLHGPLARVELGQYRVQGLDYYYTLQGWIKGVNMPYASDPGNDGYAGKNLRVGRDVFSYTLGYYEHDYKPANAANIIADTRDQVWTRFKAQMGTDHGLYNGNIAWMITDLKQVGADKGARAKGMQAMLYKYDQLHRIVRSRSLTTYTPTGFDPRGIGPEAYDGDYRYDANGNLLTLTRQDQSGELMDDFTYSYYKGTNKLRYHEAITRDTTYSGAIVSENKIFRRITVEGTAYAPAGKEAVIKAVENIDMADGGFTVEPDASFRGYIVGETEGAYMYDAIGNLILDQYQGVKINWTPYGKVRSVHKDDSTTVTFRYDAAGNRVEKKVLRPDSTVIITRYVRDASGNVMAVYSRSSLLEQPLYGTSRLGIYKGGSNAAERKLGTRQFELNNHLGNVLTVVTDNIRMTADSTWATVIHANDYYPFGLDMPGRSSAKAQEGNRALVLKGSTYANTDNKILPEISNSFTVELWVNPTSPHEVDAVSTSGTGGVTGQKYVIHPANGGTGGGAGMGISVGTNGVSVYENADAYTPALLSWSGPLTGWTHIAVVYTDRQPALYINGVLAKTGLTSLKDHVHPSYGFMGSTYGSMEGSVDEIRIWNVARTAEEIQTNYSKTIERNTPHLAGYWTMNESYGVLAQDVTHHGLDQPSIANVEWTALGTGAPVIEDAGNSGASVADYRFGFNGKEKDDGGEFGNTYYDYGFRIYNPSIGKFLSIDPLTKEYPMLTPYQFASNTPIQAIDLDGLEAFFVQAGVRASVPIIPSGLGITIAVNAGVAFDLHGNVGFYSTPSAGAQNGVGVALGFSGGVNLEADNINDIAGWGLNAGGFAGGPGIPVEGSLEFNSSLEGKSNNLLELLMDPRTEYNFGANIGIPGTPGFTAGGSFYGEVAYTKYHKQLNIWDAIKENGIDKVVEDIVNQYSSFFESLSGSTIEDIGLNKNKLRESIKAAVNVVQQVTSNSQKSIQEPKIKATTKEKDEKLEATPRKKGDSL